MKSKNDRTGKGGKPSKNKNTPKEKRKVPVSIVLHTGVLTIIDMMAAEQNRTRSNFIATALADFIARNNQQENT